MKEDMAYLWTVNDMVQRKLKKKNAPLYYLAISREVVKLDK